MISKWRFCVFLLLLVQGCLHLSGVGAAYREVWLENTVDVDITSVAIGREGNGCSEFGVLGSKGAGKVAVVAVRFDSEFPVRWEQDFNGVWHHALVDLRQFKDVENRAIIMRYAGDGRWEASLGREIRSAKKK